MTMQTPAYGPYGLELLRTERRVAPILFEQPVIRFVAHGLFRRQTDGLAQNDVLRRSQMQYVCNLLLV